jgi:hypothetical protein
MNAHKFKQIIQQIVREELKIALPSAISKVLKENKVTPVELDYEEDSTDSFFEDLKKELSGAPAVSKQQPKEIKKFSNNPVLNQILNETQGGIPKETLPSHLNEMFMKPERQSLNIIDNTKKKTPTSTVETHNPVIETVSPALLTEETKAQAQLGVFKDYRKLMKAMDKKKTSSFGGNSLVSMDGNITPSDFNKTI